MPIHVHYATTSDGVSVAYWAMGEGPALVIPPIIATSHLELEWQIPTRPAAYECLARGARVVRYDCRGMGMSQRDAIDFSLEAALADLEAVLARLDVERFALLLLPSAGDVALAYAARHPERVSHLIVWEGQMIQDDLDPPRSRQIRAIEPVMDADWDLYVRVRARIIAGWDGSNAPLVEEILRATHTPASMKAMNVALLGADPSPFLGDVRAPAAARMAPASSPRASPTPTSSPCESPPSAPTRTRAAFRRCSTSSTPTAPPLPSRRVATSARGCASSSTATSRSIRR